MYNLSGTANGNIRHSSGRLWACGRTAHDLIDWRPDSFLGVCLSPSVGGRAQCEAAVPRPGATGSLGEPRQSWRSLGPKHL